MTSDGRRTRETPDIDLRFDEIDLRDQPSAKPRTSGSRSRAAHATSLPFLDLLQDPWLREQAFLDAVDLCDRGVVASSSADPRTTAWSELLEVLSQLGARSGYVGEFKIRLDHAIETARTLPLGDRALAARLVLDRTAARAANARDFRHGILAARAIDAESVSPRSVVGSVLRPCLRHRDRTLGATIVGLGLSATLSVLASGSGRCITADDVWALRAALSAVPTSQGTQLSALAAKVTGRDRRILDALFNADAPHQSRRRARAWAKLEEELRREEPRSG